MIEVIIGLILLWILSPNEKNVKQQERDDIDVFFLEEMDNYYDEKND
jgi:hypothetical protein